MNDPDDLERQLRARRPTAELDRDRILFEAGRRAGRREGRSVLWPLATLLSTALAIALGLQVALRDAPGEREPTVPPLPPVPPPSLWTRMPAPAPPVGRQWEQRVLEEGLDALGPLTPLAPTNTPFPLGELK
jgi:hypothetical protein